MAQKADTFKREIETHENQIQDQTRRVDLEDYFGELHGETQQRIFEALVQKDDFMNAILILKKREDVMTRVAKITS
jgi:hypothetical protein